MLKTKLGKHSVYYHNKEEYHSLKREVFGQQPYLFSSDSPTPTIIDAGAHIGLSSLFFLEQYPGAKIWAVEPHPTSFACLEQTVFENNLAITPLNAALWPERTKLTLHQDTDEWWSATGITKGSWQKSQKTTPFSVETVTLSELMQLTGGTIDLLKLDIEGSEGAVLKAAQDLLPRIKAIRMEYHPNSELSLRQMHALLQKYYTVTLYKSGKKTQLRTTDGLFHISCDPR